VQTKLYTEDWIGLRTLDEAGKVKFFNLSGDHLDITHSDMKTYIVPYLKDHNHIVPYLKDHNHIAPFLKDQMKES
jgi:palmitoyl-protein thioesterase